MATNPLPPLSLLHKRLRYEAETGRLFWRERKPGPDISAHQAKAWSAKYAGIEAGGIGLNGYRCIVLQKHRLLAHRVVWYMHYGSEPNIIDHINNDKLDNRICNLRTGTLAQNNQNIGKRRNASSKYYGVYKRHYCNSWTATFCAHGESTYLGSFKSEILAAKAYDAAAREANTWHRLNFPDTP